MEQIHKFGRFIIAALFFCIFGFTSWSQEITYEGESEGVLMLSVSEFNVKKKDAVSQAVKDAFFQLLFRGIPGSKEYNKALLGTNEYDKNIRYYNNMTNSGRLFSFVTYSNLHYYKRKQAVVKISLNVQALVSDLERNNLYRRFGLY